MNRSSPVLKVSLHSDDFMDFLANPDEPGIHLLRPLFVVLACDT